VETELLIAHGNTAREQYQPEQALAYYAQALIQDRHHAGAFNNYGNVLRECGEPTGAIPFLQRSIQLDPTNVTAKFNLAVAHLLSGDYAQGWTAYEVRWQYEHLANTLPKFEQPRWTGQDLKDKTILITAEQGLGDTIQFIRFIFGLHSRGAKVKLQVNNNLAPLFEDSAIISEIIDSNNTPTDFDYWSPIMSLAGIMGVTIENLPQDLQYLSARPDLIQAWHERLGPKNRLRVGFCWSGRPDSWINQHKAMPFETMRSLIERNPNYEWINLQVECSKEESASLEQLGVKRYPGAIRSFADTAALVHHLDVVISVDTAVAHLSGAMGRPTWIPLNCYGTDWRWLLNRDDCPWYPAARLFRQSKMGDWNSVTEKIHKFLSWYKI
jgi:tetratricopeptide (TPR) repeat protein